MSSDIEKHQQLLSALKAAQANGNAAVDQSVIDAFKHVFEHLDRLNSHTSLGGPDGEERELKAGESPTLR